ncbi:Gfo/Idh/MocA family protein [Pseudonocardia sp. TRM90224]|uniref:Gfo/Idh/MocA family protein n=1 Tax=Pseudonocardia sp. TRM90224 TaxID=2812678 RepID=UPI001E493DDC|nr:Gfo/Idh/MocA family oxidoreductase [Pseudonocardia sp. TRM90224]
MIKVGVVGASPERSWAAVAHVPALLADPRFALTAVATSREESARRAAAEFGAAHWFTDARELAAHPDVDLVAITVKVPMHAELITAVLDAGKHVLSEWPLALDTAEAESLTAAARGVNAAVGLQARFAPAVVRAAELVAEGFVGRVTSVNVTAGRAKGAGGAIPAWAAYTMDRSNGAGLVEVLGGHILDAVQQIVGPIVDVAAGLSVQHPDFTVIETGAPGTATSPDAMVLAGRTSGGAAFAASIVDAVPADPGTRIDVVGTGGRLAVVSAPTDPRLAQIQIGGLKLLGIRAGEGEWTELVDPGAVGPHTNVAALYAQLADDIETGGSATPDFAAAVRLHRLLDAVRASAADGTRRTV